MASYRLWEVMVTDEIDVAEYISNHIFFVPYRPYWLVVGVLHIHSHESDIPGFCCSVYTRDKGMLFGTDINGAVEGVSICILGLWYKLSVYIQLTK